ncbi:phosphopantetheine-binding protein [Actinacidiphila oryziradicis]|uniref:Acyl carrier protein n=1 Tax=Actinacidiphila oryziradicis TaxID=2571141 RepID=A0A4V5MZ00_9ACTN|nr:phosphopantetheine-binding protein [Actinacidiphila oryziradicis]TJZ96058.1 acyl carrier protein [Actinacidiphila oryziradicis]
MIRVLVATVNRPRAGRHALRIAAAVAGLPGDPAGYRFPHPRASVTHTDQVGVAAVLVAGPAAGVGVDLEHDQPVRPATARFYLHDDEPHDDLLRLWTVKEAMFKADPANATRTLRDYRADDPAYQHVSARHLGGWLTVAARLAREPMPTNTISFETVASRVAGVLRVPETDLTPQTLIKDLAADSFMMVEMIVDLQEEFDAVFTQARLREVDSLSELVELLQESAA